MVIVGIFFALLIAIGGLAEGDLAAVALVGIFGLFLAAAGISLATAVVRVDSQGIQYRYGLLRYDIRREDVESVEVGAGSSDALARVALIVRRKGRRGVRLTPLQRYATRDGKQAMFVAAVAIQRALGHDLNSERSALPG
jgi:hypothetical protein